MAVHIRDSARKAARDQMLKENPNEAGNVKRLEKRDNAVYSFWGLDKDRSGGPEIEDLILKNALRIILEKKGKKFNDITDLDMMDEASTPHKVEVTDDEIKAAIDLAIGKVTMSATSTNKQVDAKHELDFVRVIDPNRENVGVLVKTSDGTIPSVTHDPKKA